MHMIVKDMELKYAREISLWKYDEPYSMYSMNGDWDTIEELMNGTYYSVFVDDNLIGYFCYGESAKVPGGTIEGLYDSPHTLDIGLGLRPDLTGKGKGLEFVLKGIEFGVSRYKPEKVRLTVAQFNRRAIIVYQRAGFVKYACFVNKRNEEEREFIIMVKEL